MEHDSAGAGESVDVEMLEKFRVVELEVGESQVVGEVNGCGWCDMLAEVSGSTQSVKATSLLFFPCTCSVACDILSVTDVY